MLLFFFFPVECKTRIVHKLFASFFFIYLILIGFLLSILIDICIYSAEKKMATTNLNWLAGLSRSADWF